MKTASSHSGQILYSAVALNAQSDACQSTKTWQCGHATRRLAGATRWFEAVGCIRLDHRWKQIL